MYSKLSCGHVFLFFILTCKSHLHCRTVGPCPVYTAAPMQRGTQLWATRKPRAPVLVAPLGMTSLPPHVFIMTEAQPNPPELKNREEIHVFSSV